MQTNKNHEGIFKTEKNNIGEQRIKNTNTPQSEKLQVVTLTKKN